MAWMTLYPRNFFVVAIFLVFPLIFVLDLIWLESAGGLGGVLIEAHGLVFDLIVFGIVLPIARDSISCELSCGFHTLAKRSILVHSRRGDAVGGVDESLAGNSSLADTSVLIKHRMHSLKLEMFIGQQLQK
jgi:hypothetical protein